MTLIIDAKNLYFEYYGGYRGLVDVSLSLNANQKIIIYGREGSGKTTLLRILAGLEQSQKGSIFCLGKDLSAIDIQNRNFGYSFYFESLGAKKTVEDILRFPLTLRKFNQEDCNDLINKMLNIINLSKTKKVQELSSLEKAKLILARLFIFDRDLYLVDDLTKELIDEEKQEYYTLLKSFAKDKSVVIATCDKDFALSYGDNICIMSDGIGESKKIQELYKSPQNTEEAIFCYYELHIAKLSKDNCGYYCDIFGKKEYVHKPINDIYLDKEVCFAVKDNKVCGFYFDCHNNKIISENE